MLLTEINRTEANSFQKAQMIKQNCKKNNNNLEEPSTRHHGETQIGIVI